MFTKVPFLLILGDKEEESQKVSVRTRGGEDLGSIKLEDFITILESSIKVIVLPIRHPFSRPE